MRKANEKLKQQQKQMGVEDALAPDVQHRHVTTTCIQCISTCIDMYRHVFTKIHQSATLFSVPLCSTVQHCIYGTLEASTASTAERSKNSPTILRTCKQR